jgi:hypothetical protein
MAITDLRLGNYLAGEQLEQYQRDGFVTLRTVFSEDEIASLRRDADRLLRRPDSVDTANIRCRWQEPR